jgi:RNA polymerase sigma-70 factor (ECF subfamily)
MLNTEPRTEQLLAATKQGEQWARNALLVRFRGRLKALVLMRMHDRMAARLDASDVVQESLVEANHRLGDYLERQPLPFYQWLREITLERLIDLHRRHVVAQKRSVHREQQLATAPDASIDALVHCFVARGSSPSQQIQRDELGTQLHAALEQLSAIDREVLVLRHLQQLSTRDIASVLGISESAVKVRHLRALRRLRAVIGDSFGEACR